MLRAVSARCCWAHNLALVVLGRAREAWHNNPREVGPAASMAEPHAGADYLSFWPDEAFNMEQLGGMNAGDGAGQPSTSGAQLDAAAALEVLLGPGAAQLGPGSTARPSDQPVAKVCPPLRLRPCLHWVPAAVAMR